MKFPKPGAPTLANLCTVLSMQNQGIFQPQIEGPLSGSALSDTPTKRLRSLEVAEGGAKTEEGRKEGERKSV